MCVVNNTQTRCIMRLYITVIRTSARRDEPKAVNVTAFISAQIGTRSYAEESNIIPYI
jgi:hypothetical protein